MGREREVLNSRGRGAKPYDVPEGGRKGAVEAAGERRNSKFKVLLLSAEELEDPTWQHRLQQRARQVEFGKNTLGYDRYSEIVPRRSRRKEDPWTPNIRLNVSKRSWEGIVKKWRRELHNWDPNVENERVQQAVQEYEERTGRILSGSASQENQEPSKPSFASVLKGRVSSGGEETQKEEFVDVLLDSLRGDEEEETEEDLGRCMEEMVPCSIEDLLADLDQAEAEANALLLEDSQAAEDLLISTIDCPEDSIDFLDQKLGKMLHTSDATTTEQGQGQGQEQEQERQEPALPAKQKSWADMVEDEEGAEEEDILW